MIISTPLVQYGPVIRQQRTRETIFRELLASLLYIPFGVNNIIVEGKNISRYPEDVLHLLRAKEKLAYVTQVSVRTVIRGNPGNAGITDRPLWHLFLCVIVEINKHPIHLRQKAGTSYL
tara:strand:+ start:239 stop:595 length:357 start_codon:yes stop_codon:yes gene_type:complete